MIDFRTLKFQHLSATCAFDSLPRYTGGGCGTRGTRGRVGLRLQLLPTVIQGGIVQTSK